MNLFNKYDCATITAFRTIVKDATVNTLPEVLEYEGLIVPKAVKIKWNHDLKAVLLKLKYGVTKIKGCYKEKGQDKESSENSYLAVNLNNDPDFYNNLFKLSEGYNQDSFLYKKAGDDTAYLIGTNECGFPEYGEKINVGKFSANVNLNDENYSKLNKRNFAFKRKDESIENYYLDKFEHFQNNTKMLITERAAAIMDYLDLC